MDRLHRKSLRLPSYDYSSVGWYFVTICTNDKECLFGEIRDGKMILNEIGTMIEQKWQDVAKGYTVSLDIYQIMPNHLHGIIIISPYALTHP